jgi:hypothetical protein
MYREEGYILPPTKDNGQVLSCQVTEPEGMRRLLNETNKREPNR